MVGHSTPTPFFTLDSELAELESHIRRLKASAHAPPVTRAEHVLVNIQRATFEKHEAELQIRIATSAAGFDEHRKLWQGKLDDLDQRIAELTAVLHQAVHGLRVARFQRFAAMTVIGTVVLRWLYDPKADGRPPPVLRSYLVETAFVHGSTTR